MLDRRWPFLFAERRHPKQRAGLLHSGAVDVQFRQSVLATDLFTLDVRMVVTTFEAALGRTDA